MIGTLFFDNSGNTAPVTLATTISNHTNKFDFFINPRRWNCNGDPYKLRSYTVSPENDVLPPGTPLQRSPHLFPRLDSVWNTGSHRTHLLDSNGEVVEYRATNPKLLSQLLSEKGFPEETTVTRFTERSAIRKAGDSWKAPKISVSAINRVHALFADNELTLEDYVNQLTALLDAEGRADVYGFLNSICEALENNTYSTRAKFGSKLKEAFIAFRDDGKDVAEDDEGAEHGTAEATAAKLATIEGGNKHAGLKKAVTKEAAENVYASWSGLPKDDRTGTLAEQRLFQLVTKVAKAKTGKYLYSCDEVANDADDYAQKIAIKVWEEIATFKGESKSFYPWLHKMCHRAACSAYKEIKKINKMHEPLLVDKEDDDGKVYLEDNPAMHGGVMFKRNGSVTFQQELQQFRRELPAFIQGIDLEICGYIREGHSYERIAEILSMTLAAVKMRIARMRKTIEEMRTRGEL